ncbi:glycosyltransferase [Marinihelvus fidelis]|uniref:Glycosyltransferase n=1 Tax=Marinihelvus fidelis TaxID=2613842 RepID=A0A5N0TEM1_9GAMM|nr:glycosyltransferase [Marinihelvus fidelis]KAA9133430.1 glycosyltransferase [Marinihelvus fidelis]
MRVLIISLEAPLDDGRVASGNAVRTRQLRRALEGAGHDTTQAWLAPRGQRADGAFHTRDQLAGIIRSERPDVLLVGWWELLSLLPYELDAPVVLDFIAPRPLESLFETPGRVAAEMGRLRLALRRVDLVLVGTAGQAGLLHYPLIEAGFDLRQANPVCVVPMAGDICPGQPPEPGTAPLTLVAGGVDWPWRDAGDYLDAIEAAVAGSDGRLALVRLGDQGPDGRAGLLSHGDYEALLSGQAHIGVELGHANIERRHSLSFRAIDFLRHGLPLLCSDHLPIARWVEAYDAGWVVSDPADIAAILERLRRDPEAWRRCRDNALRLATERFEPDTAAAPLLRWMASPRPAPRLAVHGVAEADPPVIGVPPLRERLARRYRLARRVLLARMLGRKPCGDAIVMVTRSDLFPTDHGAAVKIVETARGLASHDREVALVTDDRKHWLRVSEDGHFEKVRYPWWLKLFARPLPWVKLDHYTRDIPESNAFLYLPMTDGSWFWRVLHVAGRTGAGVLQAEFPAYALPCRQAADVLGAATVLVEHNVEYARLRDQVPELSDDQFRRLRAIEIDLCNRADAVICVSDNDRQRLAEDGVHPGLLHTVPHGINLVAFDSAVAAPARSQFGIPDHALLMAYHGTFAYPPNRDALQMFADEILPRLQAEGIDAHVLAIGHSPPSGLHPKIHCTGSVETVPPWLKAADMAVVPLRDGGGTRMKIVDCFAAGLPVISTAKGIEGIPVVDGREAMVRDEWDTLCAAVANVAADPALAERLRSGGRALAESLDWSEIARRYLAIQSTLR